MMGRKYKAIIRGNRLEWIGGPPALGPAASVTITVDEDDAEGVDERTLGDGTIKQILEDLAEQGGIDIADPVAWQRDIRRDRALPGRDPHDG